MRLYPISLLLAGCLYVLSGCNKNDADPNIPVLDLSTDFVLNKSDRDIEVTLDMNVPDGVKTLVISKGVNLKPDAVYGLDTVVPAPTGEKKFRYVFHYTLQRSEIDKLVGFNFKLTDNSGRIVEKDLTVHTEANGAETIYSKKWMLKSTLRITATPAKEELDPCVADNIFSFAKDSTMSVVYGPPCGFDGFNVYDKWRLSEDEKTFTWEYFNLFIPASRTTEVFNVRKISSSELVMDITIDLSWMGTGYTDHEQFVYTFTPAP